MTDAGPQVLSDPSEHVDADVVFRQLGCPGCMTAIWSGIVLRDHVADTSCFAGSGEV